MKPLLLAGLLLGLLVLMPAAVTSRIRPTDSPQRGVSAQKNSQDRSSAAKETEPFPQVPRITAEEVERLLKQKTPVVLVDTDDSMSYGAEHIKGAINIAYDPTVDARDQDSALGVLPGNRLIVFYCNCSHEEDSAPLVLEMWQLGYDHDQVKALRGGLTRWEKLGYPLAGSSTNASAEKGN
jgi:rhodanese-related sulfurtransferase